MEDERQAIYRTGRQYLEDTTVAEANSERILIAEHRHALPRPREGPRP